MADANVGASASQGDPGTRTSSRDRPPVNYTDPDDRAQPARGSKILYPQKDPESGSWRKFPGEVIMGVVEGGPIEFMFDHQDNYVMKVPWAEWENGTLIVVDESEIMPSPGGGKAKTVATKRLRGTDDGSRDQSADNDNMDESSDGIMSATAQGRPVKKAKNTKSHGALLFEVVLEHQRTLSDADADAGVSKKKLIELTVSTGLMTETNLNSQLAKFARKIKDQKNPHVAEYPSARWESFGKNRNRRYKVTDRGHSSALLCHEGHLKGTAHATVTAKKWMDENATDEARSQKKDAGSSAKSLMGKSTSVGSLPLDGELCGNPQPSEFSKLINAASEEKLTISFVDAGGKRCVLDLRQWTQQCQSTTRNIRLDCEHGLQWHQGPDDWVVYTQAQQDQLFESAQTELLKQLTRQPRGSYEQAMLQKLKHTKEHEDWYPGATDTDGDCFYQSIIDAAEDHYKHENKQGPHMSVQTMRNDVADFLDSNRSWPNDTGWENSIGSTKNPEDYIGAVRKLGGEWATEITMRALLEVKDPPETGQLKYNFHIRIVSHILDKPDTNISHGSAENSGTGSEPAALPIAYVFWNHYIPLLRIGNSNGDGATSSSASPALAAPSALLLRFNLGADEFDEMGLNARLNDLHDINPKLPELNSADHVFHFSDLATEWLPPVSGDDEDVRPRYHNYLWSLVRELLSLGQKGEESTPFLEAMEMANSAVPALEENLQYHDWSKLSIERDLAWGSACDFFGRISPSWWPQFMACAGDVKGGVCRLRPDHDNGIEGAVLCFDLDDVKDVDPAGAPAGAPVIFVDQANIENAWTIDILVRQKTDVEALWPLLRPAPPPIDQFTICASVELKRVQDGAAGEYDPDTLIETSIEVVMGADDIWDWAGLLAELQKKISEDDPTIKPKFDSDEDGDNCRAQEEWQLFCRQPKTSAQVVLDAKLDGTYEKIQATPPPKVKPPKPKGVKPPQQRHARRVFDAVLAALIPEFLAQVDFSAYLADSNVEFTSGTRDKLKAVASERFPNGVKCTVLVPNFSTLVAQTQGRLNDDHSQLVHHGCCTPSTSVIKYTVGAKDNLRRDPPKSDGEKYHSFLKMIREDVNGDTLFVIIADEHHANIQAAASKDGKDPPAHHLFTNNPDVLLRPNVVVFDVSATPFVNITRDSRIHPWNRVTWKQIKEDNEAAKEGEEPHRYLGLSDFLRDMGRDNIFPGTHHIRTDPCFRSLCGVAERLKLDKGAKFHVDDLLAVDYAVSLAIREAVLGNADNDAQLASATYKALETIISNNKNSEINEAWSIYKMHMIELHRSQLGKNAGDDSLLKNPVPNWKKLREAFLADPPDAEKAFLAMWKLKLDSKKFIEKLARQRKGGESSGRNEDRDFNLWEWHSHFWTETDRVVESVLVGKRVHVIRTSSAGQKPGTRFYTLLREVRSRYQVRRDRPQEPSSPPRYEVCPDYGEANLNLTMTPHFKDKTLNLLRARADNKAKEAETAGRPLPPKFVPNKAAIAFEHLDWRDVDAEGRRDPKTGAGCFLVLVDKGRMGDTFSDVFGGMDLRLRNREKDTKSTHVTHIGGVIQELGRLAKWRPTKELLPNEAESTHPLTNPDIPTALVGGKLYAGLMEGINNGLEVDCLLQIYRDIDEKCSMSSAGEGWVPLKLKARSLGSHYRFYKPPQTPPDSFERVKKKRFLKQDEVATGDDDEFIQGQFIELKRVDWGRFKEFKAAVGDVDEVRWENLVKLDVDRSFTKPPAKRGADRNEHSRKIEYDQLRATPRSFDFARAGLPVHETVDKDWAADPALRGSFGAVATPFADNPRLVALRDGNGGSVELPKMPREEFPTSFFGKHLEDDAMNWGLAANGLPVWIHSVEAIPEKGKPILCRCSGWLVVKKSKGGAGLDVSVALRSEVEFLRDGACEVQVTMPLWIDPRRIALFGLPQIGKTGTYFTFVELMQDFLKPDPGPPPDDAPMTFTEYPNFPAGLPHWLDGSRHLRKRCDFGTKWVKYHSREARFRALTLVRSIATPPRSEWKQRFAESIGAHEVHSSNSDRKERLNFFLFEIKTPEDRLLSAVQMSPTSSATPDYFTITIGEESDEDRRCLLGFMNDVLNWDGRLKPTVKNWKVVFENWKTVIGAERRADSSKVTVLDMIALDNHLDVAKVSKRWCLMDLLKGQYAGPPKKVFVHPRKPDQPAPIVNKRYDMLAGHPDGGKQGRVYYFADTVWTKVEKDCCVRLNFFNCPRPQLWVPSSMTQHVQLDNDNAVMSIGGVDLELRHPAFIPSYDHHTVGYLDWMAAGKAIQILVVRSGDQFDRYRKCWGATHLVLALPSKLSLNNEDMTAEDGKIGYARLFCQILAHGLGLQWAWLVDDNVKWVKMMQLVPGTHGEPDTAGFVTRSMIDVMKPIEEVAGLEFTTPRTPPLNTEQFKDKKGLPFREYAESDENKVLSGIKIDFDGLSEIPAASSKPGFAGCPGTQLAVIGLERDCRNYKDVLSGRRLPFTFTRSTYSMFLLNVRLTIEKKVLYPPRSHWEDIDFNEQCESKGLGVVKSGTSMHHKDQNQHIHKQRSDEVVMTVNMYDLSTWRPDSADEPPQAAGHPKDLTIATLSCRALKEKILKEKMGTLEDSSTFLLFDNAFHRAGVHEDANDDANAGQNDRDSLFKAFDAEVPVHPNSLRDEDFLDEAEDGSFAVYGYFMPKVTVKIHVYGLTGPIDYTAHGTKLNGDAVKQALSDEFSARGIDLHFDHFEWCSAGFESPIDPAVALDEANKYFEMWCRGGVYQWSFRTMAESNVLLNNPDVQQNVLSNVLLNDPDMGVPSGKYVLFCGGTILDDAVTARAGLPPRNFNEDNFQWFDKSMMSARSYVVLCGGLLCATGPMTEETWMQFWRAIALCISLKDKMQSALVPIFVVLAVKDVPVALKAWTDALAKETPDTLRKMSATTTYSVVPPVEQAGEASMAEGSHCIVKFTPTGIDSQGAQGATSAVEVTGVSSPDAADGPAPSKRARLDNSSDGVSTEGTVLQNA